MTDLPEGWEWTTLGEVCHKPQYGWTTKSSADADGHPYLRTTDITHGPIDWSRVPRCMQDPPDPSAFILEDGDIVVSRAGSVGASAVVKSPPSAVFASYLIRLRAVRPIVPAYLGNFLQSSAYWSQISEAKVGIAVQNVNATKLAAIAIPVPPVDEQERIVAAIEEHTSRLGTAGEYVSAGRRRLAIFERGLLDEAIEGDPVPLRELLSEPLRNGLSAPASSVGSIRVVTLTAVTKASFVDGNTKLIEPGDRSVGDLWMRPGDIFVQRSNTPELVGTAALFEGPEHWAIFPDLLIRVRADGNKIDASYLELALRSTSVRRYFQRSAQGIAGSMPKISQPIVEEAPIPVPCLERQKSIVHRFSENSEIARRTGADIDRSDVRMRSLRLSILAAAFSGQLVPQDPDDEPASVLLERIRAERAAATPAKRSRRTASTDRPRVE